MTKKMIFTEGSITNKSSNTEEINQDFELSRQRIIDAVKEGTPEEQAMYYAKFNNLDNKATKIYMKFMKNKSPLTYAIWAGRFKDHEEYMFADKDDSALLRKISPTYYGFGRDRFDFD